MPITDINSYIETTQEFDINWDMANSALGDGPIVLAGQYTRANFVTDRATLLDLINSARAQQQTERTAYVTLGIAKQNLLVRTKQLRRAVLSKITFVPYLDRLVAAPRLNSDPLVFIEPIQTMERLWVDINDNFAAQGLSGPLTLAEDYDLAAYQTDIAGVATLYGEAKRAVEVATMTCAERNNAMKAIYERLKQYRAAAPAYLPANSPVLAALPRLSPPPGTTPPPLGATGEWNPTTLQADLAWEPTTDATVDRIQIRGCTGEAYHADREVVVATLAGHATSWSGDWGLEVEGAVANFKAVAMTTTGNENGGKAVEIVRPEIL